MTADLVVTPRASRDLRDICKCYDAERPGLGEAFLAETDDLVRIVRRYPEAYPLVFVCYRRALLTRFPYAVFYRYVDGIVTIYAVMHTARNPRAIRRRLPGIT
jgi:plasmid stabilization system protein ParE